MINVDFDYAVNLSRFSIPVEKMQEDPELRDLTKDGTVSHPNSWLRLLKEISHTHLVEVVDGS